MTKIILKDILIHGNIGTNGKTEKTIGADFNINIEIEADFEKACKTDCLDYAIDYDKVFGIVKTEMSKECNLVENVAYRIFGAIKSSFPQIVRLSLEVCKLRPPVDGVVGAACIKIED